METLIRNVRDLDENARAALELVVGHQLGVSQRVILNMVNLNLNSALPVPSESFPNVPEHWKLYEGLSEDEIDGLDQEFRQRANLTRT